MSFFIQRTSKSPEVPDDYFPCPQCKKQLRPEEFNPHLKSCNFPDVDDSFTSRHLSIKSIFNQEDIRVICKTCGRKFLPDRISKHELICENLVKNRPTFDITRKLFPGSEQSFSIKSKKKIKFSKEFENRLWNKQHQDFINKMRFARKIVEEEEKGHSPIKLKPPLNLSEDLIECPVCHRKFAALPADRHIPKCKDIVHKPRPPPLYREPSTKLPSISNSKLKEMKAEACSLSPSLSKGNLERSPNTTLNFIPIERYSEGRRSFKEKKVFAKCPHCRKTVFQGNMKLHQLSCKYASKQEETVSAIRCPSCYFTSVPEANFCMMCGAKYR
jgi:hypothetical protein